jgi:hypothetical protein
MTLAFASCLISTEERDVSIFFSSSSGEISNARQLPTTRAACDHMTLSRQSTRIARYRSYIKLKFIKHFCSSCKALAKQVTRKSKVPLYIFRRNNIRSISTLKLETGPPKTLLTFNYLHSIISQKT